MHRLLLIGISLAISAVALSTMSGASLAADASPKPSAAPTSPSADNPSWQEYKKLLENYYFLDKQKAGHISCNVSAPILQGSVDAIRQKFGDKLTIDENLHDFSVTYDRAQGVSFNLPHIKASFRPDAKHADAEHDENLLKAIEKALNDFVVGEENLIANSLADMNMISHSPEKQKNLSLAKNGDAIVVSFDGDENEHTSIIYSGTTQKHTNSSPTFNATFTSDYQPLNGKLAVAHVVEEKTEGPKKINSPTNTEMTVGPAKTNTITSISYQDLGSAFFPAQILMDGTTSVDIPQFKQQHHEVDFKNGAMSFDPQQIKMHQEIDFKDCKTSDLSP